MSIEKRQELYDAYEADIQHLAFKSTKKELSTNECMAVIIDAADPQFSELVAVLMPNHDWRAVQDAGGRPIACGIVLAEGMVRYLSQLAPELVPSLTDTLPSGIVRAVVLSDGGASVYHIKPFPHFRDS